ncbi:hypothetical protein SNEBB_004535 [Seison nebaliae]|nr:hypothetical protein SNEBB_004535 [Seison nebaliae]
MELHQMLQECCNQTPRTSTSFRRAVILPPPGPVFPRIYDDQSINSPLSAYLFNEDNSTVCETSVREILENFRIENDVVLYNGHTNMHPHLQQFATPDMVSPSRPIHSNDLRNISMMNQENRYFDRFHPHGHRNFYPRRRSTTRTHFNSPQQEFYPPFPIRRAPISFSINSVQLQRMPIQSNLHQFHMDYYSSQNNDEEFIGGYAYKLAVGQNNGILTEYNCPICLNIIKDAIQTTCGHRFCLTCYERYVAQSSTTLTDHVRCPIDKLPLEGIFSDVAFRREILSLKVECENSHCEWTGEIRNMKKHVDECNAVEIQCPFEMAIQQFIDMCSHSFDVRPMKCLLDKHKSVNKVHFSSMQYHLDNECPLRPVVCERCDEGEYALKLFKTIDWTSYVLKEQMERFRRNFQPINQLNEETIKKNNSQVNVFYLLLIDHSFKCYHKNESSKNIIFQNGNPYYLPYIRPHSCKNIGRDGE